MRENAAEDRAAGDREPRVGHGLLRPAEHVQVVVGGIPQTVAQAQLHRISRGLVGRDADRAENAVLDSDFGGGLEHLDARLGRTRGIAIAFESPARHECAMPDGDVAQVAGRLGAVLDVAASGPRTYRPRPVTRRPSSVNRLLLPPLTESASAWLAR